MTETESLPPTPGKLMADAISHAVSVVEHATGLTVHPAARLNQCCRQDEDGQTCPLPADYQIRERGTTREGTPDDDSYACAAHLEQMLGHCGDPLPGRVVQYLVTYIGLPRGGLPGSVEP